MHLHLDDYDNDRKLPYKESENAIHEKGMGNDYTNTETPVAADKSEDEEVESEITTEHAEVDKAADKSEDEEVESETTTEHAEVVQNRGLGVKTIHGVDI